MKHHHSDLPLYEQFTIQGFWAVSGWAFLFSVQMIPVAYNLKPDNWLAEWGFWEISGCVYGIIWLFFFLFVCLIPKLRGEK